MINSGGIARPPERHLAVTSDHFESEEAAESCSLPVPISLPQPRPHQSAAPEGAELS